MEQLSELSHVTILLVLGLCTHCYCTERIYSRIGNILSNNGNQVFGEDRHPAADLKQTLMLAFMPEKSCHVQLENNFGTFSPPMYSGNVNLWCNWTIVAGPGKHVVVYIKGFQADASCDENWDEIIFEGVSSTVETNVVYACWNKNTHVFAAQATAVHVVFFWLSFSHVRSKKYFEGSYYIFEDPVTSAWAPDKPVIKTTSMPAVYSSGKLKQTSDTPALYSTVFPSDFKQTKDKGSIFTTKRIKLSEKQKERETETSRERKITSSAPPTGITFINGLLRNVKKTFMAQHKDILLYRNTSQQIEEDIEMRSLAGVQPGSTDNEEASSKFLYLFSSKEPTLVRDTTKPSLQSNMESKVVQSLSFAPSSADTLGQISSFTKEIGRTQEQVSEMITMVPTIPSFITPTDVTYEKSLLSEINNTFMSQSDGIPSYWKGSQQVEGILKDIRSLDGIQSASINQIETLLSTANEQEHTLAGHILHHTLQPSIESTLSQALLFASSPTDTLVQIASLKKETDQTLEQDSELMIMVPTIPSFTTPTEVTYEDSLPRKIKNNFMSMSHGIPSHWKGIQQTEKVNGLQSARIDQKETLSKSLYLSTVSEQKHTMAGHLLQQTFQSNIESLFGQAQLFAPSSFASSYDQEHSQTQEVASILMSLGSKIFSSVTPTEVAFDRELRFYTKTTLMPQSEEMSSHWSGSELLNELNMNMRSQGGVQESLPQYLYMSISSEQEHVLPGDTAQPFLQSSIYSSVVQSLSFSPDFIGSQSLKLDLSFTDAPVQIAHLEEKESIMMTLECLASSSQELAELVLNPSKSLEFHGKTPWFSEIFQIESVMAIEEYIKLPSSPQKTLYFSDWSVGSKRLTEVTKSAVGFSTWWAVSSTEELLASHSRIVAEMEFDKISQYKAGVGHPHLTTSPLENTQSVASSMVSSKSNFALSSQFTSSVNAKALDSVFTDSFQMDYPPQDIHNAFSDLQKLLDTLSDSPYSALVASHISPDHGHGYNDQPSQMVGTEYIHNHLVPSGESSFGESLREATLLIASATEETKPEYFTQDIQLPDKQKVEMQISNVALSTAMPKMSSFLSDSIEQASVPTHLSQIYESQPRPRGHTTVYQETPITAFTAIVEAEIQSTYPYQPFFDFDYIPSDRPRAANIDILDMATSFGNNGNKTNLGFLHFPGERLFAITAEVQHDELLPLGLETYVFQLVQEELPEATFFLPVGKWGEGNHTTNNNTMLSFWLHLKRGGRDMENVTENHLKALVNSSLGKLNATMVSFSAEDVNECQLEIHQCDIQADCTNENGTYSCHCKDGYKDDSLAALGIVCIKSQNSVLRLLYIQLEVWLGTTVAVAVVFFIIFTILCTLLQNRHPKGNSSLREADPAISQLGRIPLDPSPQREMGYILSTNPQHMSLQFAPDRHTGREGPGTLEMMKITVEQTAC
eukprot:XP_002939555.3 PREDICTED: uncharacterized protein LOC100490207 isoform X1 [Xenopus tropicalis]